MATGRHSIDLTFLFDNDFADLFEVRGARRPRRGTGTSELLSPADVRFEYHGLDGEARTTNLHFDPRPTLLAVNSAQLSFRARAAAAYLAVRRGHLQLCRGAPAGAVHAWPAGASPRNAPFDRGRHQHRNLEQHLQRGAVPVDGRSQHADDRDRAWPLSLCRHSLVFDHVRPRRPDHRAADAVDRSARGLRRAQTAGRLSGQGRRCPERCRTRQDPA